MYVIQYKVTRDDNWHTFFEWCSNHEEEEFRLLTEARREYNNRKTYYIKQKKKFRDNEGFIRQITHLRVCKKRVSYHPIE